MISPVVEEAVGTHARHAVSQFNSFSEMLQALD
jgi:hypothetical protein